MSGLFAIKVSNTYIYLSIEYRGTTHLFQHSRAGDNFEDDYGLKVGDEEEDEDDDDDDDDEDSETGSEGFEALLDGLFAIKVSNTYIYLSIEYRGTTHLFQHSRAQLAQRL
jgi:NADH:ubiquinone oxidoreductase subunit F (NADH-binding)